MSKKYFIPQKQTDYVEWHDTFKGGVSATTPGATGPDVIQISGDNSTLHAKLVVANNADNAAKAAHKDLNAIIASSKTNARLLAGRIKRSPAYTATVGELLGIIGAEDSTDMTQEQPVLDATAKIGGVVEIGFNKLDAEGIHIYELRDGQTGFTLLASETHSPYVDNRPLLVAGKPETRQYKAVFFIGKAEIGLESAVVVATAKP